MRSFKYRELKNDGGCPLLKRVMLWGIGGVLALAMTTTFESAQAASLSTSGAVLTDLRADIDNAQISQTIDLNGDVAIATYVMAHMPDGKSLQRNNLGYWLPWNGQIDTLLDNKFVAGGSTLTFKIIDQSIRDRMFPITFVVAYRTAAAFKFGVLQVSPQ
ncbi:MAG: hypothetical protein EXQ91_00675 [Alphaproteobacteria bacterium]|nr:hypothetical protein [Alphaproteobacteria bacterium]